MGTLPSSEFGGVSITGVEETTNLGLGLLISVMSYLVSGLPLVFLSIGAPSQYFPHHLVFLALSQIC